MADERLFVGHPCCLNQRFQRKRCLHRHIGTAGHAF